MFNWKDSFSVQIPLIDEQHKRLFEIANTLFAVLESSDEDQFDDLYQCIDDLKKYTHYHFTQEEQLMRLYDYKDLRSHRQEHQELISYLNQIDVAYVSFQPKASAKELLTKLLTWITNHILQSDMKYSAHIQKAMAEERNRIR